MELSKALKKALDEDRHAKDDPFILHCRVSDIIGNDYQNKKAAEEFYRLNSKHNLSKTLIDYGKPKRAKCKKHKYKLKPQPAPTDNTYVFYTKERNLLHISPQCSRLKSADAIYRTTFDRTGELYKKGGRCVCRVCGGFAPMHAKNPFYKITKFMFYEFGVNSKFEKLYYIKRYWRYKQ